MTTDIKILADVQPGGRVRLGDDALSTSEGARRYVADYFATHLRRHDFGNYILTELAADFSCALAQHLSAQPSPDGQGEVCIPLPTPGNGEWSDGWNACREAMLRGEGEALAARQPVGISAEWVLGYLTTDAPEDSREAIRNAFAEYAALSGARQPMDLIAQKVGDYRVTVAEDAITVSRGREIVFAYSAGDPEPIMASQTVGEPFAYGSSAGHQPIPASIYRPNSESCRELYDIPLYAAQALDLGQSIPSELAPVAAALKRFEECAEDCGSEGCDIGRAWFDALTTMGLLRRTQRSPAVWTMTAEGERLLALIDSQAVGK